MAFVEGFGAFDEDNNYDSKIEKENWISRDGIEPRIVPAREEIIIQWKFLQKNFLYLNLII